MTTEGKEFYTVRKASYRIEWYWSNGSFHCVVFNKGSRADLYYSASSSKETALKNARNYCDLGAPR